MKDISELHIRKEIKVEGNGKVHLAIESFNSLHRKEYTLSPAMWTASEVREPAAWERALPSPLPRFFEKNRVKLS